VWQAFAVAGNAVGIQILVAVVEGGSLWKVSLENSCVPPDYKRAVTTLRGVERGFIGKSAGAV
jgi:hypothetical protein